MGRTPLPVDARDGKVSDAGDVSCGDHGQVGHSICEDSMFDEVVEVSRHLNLNHISEVMRGN